MTGRSSFKNTYLRSSLMFHTWHSHRVRLTRLYYIQVNCLIDSHATLCKFLLYIERMVLKWSFWGKVSDMELGLLYSPWNLGSWNDLCVIFKRLALLTSPVGWGNLRQGYSLGTYHSGIWMAAVRDGDVFSPEQHSWSPVCRRILIQQQGWNTDMLLIHSFNPKQWRES